MKVNGINVNGIKAAVSDVRRECADRWAILLDMSGSDWTVSERALIGQDYIVTNWPTVIIAHGNANNGWGHDTITIAELRDAIKAVMDAVEAARRDYNDGKRHIGYGHDESRLDHVRTEAQLAIEWCAEARKYARA